MSLFKKSFTAILSYLVILLIFGLLFVPSISLRAANYEKVWTSTADFNTGTNSNIDTASNQATLATTTTNASEDFTGTTYKDAATDANWDTTNHKLALPGDPANGVVTDMATLWQTTIGSAEVIKSSAFDSTNNVVYLSGTTGKFGAYIPATNSMIDLTSKISGTWGANTINSMAFDSTNGKIYLGGGTGTGPRFGCYTGGSDPTNGTWVYLSAKVTALGWSVYSLDAMTFDSTNGKVYFGGAAARFGAFTGGSDPANGTAVYLASKVVGYTIYAMGFDSTYNKVYVGGQGGALGVFTADADPVNAPNATYLTTQLATPDFDNINYWSSNSIYAFAYDPVNHYMYMGGRSSRIGVLQTAADATTITSWAYLTTQLTSPDFDNASYWSTDDINTLAYLNGKIFVGGGNGKLGVLTCANPPSGATWSYVTSSISSFWSTNAVNDLVVIPSIATVYLSGAGSTLASFMVGYTSDKNGLSSTLDATAQNIYKATLTATASTPANTGITYYLSNNGGSNWNAVTSGVEYTFTTAASDLRWKANLTTTDLSITPEITGLTISYKYFTSNTGTMDLIYDATQVVTPFALSWNTSLATNTTATYKIRSASTQVGLASATWSDTKNNADTPVNLKTINVGGVPGIAENQFSEVYITFNTSDGLGTPTLSDITEQYVINAAPELQTITASQATDGTKIVNIAYQLKDSDSHQNPYNQDQVAMTFQYSTDSGGTWHDCSTVTNSGLQSVNANNTWKSMTAAWNAGTDLANSYYLNTVKIKALANDNEQAHNTAELASSTISLDTKNPVAGALSGGGIGVKIGDGTSWTKNTTVDLTLLATDDTTKYMEVRNDTSFTGIKEDYATSKVGWALSANDGNKTVNVRFYDAYGNYTDALANVLLDTTAPNMPAHFTIFDASDPALGTYQIIAAWNVINDPSDFLHYSLERSTGGAWSEVATFSNIASDVYSDKGLSNIVTYSYRLKSVDIHTNASSYTDTKSLMPAGEDTVPPEITGTGPTPEAQDTTATISWTTDKPSDSYVEYGTTIAYGQIQGTDDLVVNHVVNLVGLNPTTTYQFRVKCRDASGNRVVSTNATFTTTLPADSAEGVNITGSTAQKPGADPEEVTIIWTTDKYSTSQVRYGTDQNNLDMITTDDTTLNKTHYVTITHLNPNTKYYYQAFSKDTYGNEVLGEMKYFVTAQSGLATPTIINAKATDITLTSAIISWETTTVSTSVVEIGDTAGTYTTHLEDESTGSTTKHLIRVPDLTSGKEYHFRVLGQSSDGGWIASDDYLFSTIPLPVITDIQVKDVASTTATISWKTNIDIVSTVSFGIDKLNESQGDTTLSKDHVTTLKALNPATGYSFQIKATDSFGNVASSGTQSFSTIIDTTAPVIKDMKSEVSITTDSNGESKAQAIISWSTDEPATSQVKYAQGVALADDYPLKTTEEASLSASHIVIISGLQPSATYHMRLISKDLSGNIATSDDYTVLTLNQDKSLLQYVIQILEERFAWLKTFGLF